MKGTHCIGSFMKLSVKNNTYFFIAENVKGILSLGKGEAIKQILADFEAAGFYTDLHLVKYGGLWGS